jgi:hypothetical protein
MTPEIEFDARCPGCGEVGLTGDQLWLVVTSGPTADYFAFRCPRCRGGVVRCPVDEGTAEVLAELLAVEELVVPAEALEQHRGDVLTVDDLIDFGAELARADFPAAAALPSAA